MASRPYTGRTTSAFGPRLAPIPGASTFHQGIDGVGGYNTAPEGGTIVQYSYAGGWGNRIVFQGDSGTVHYLTHNAPGGLLGQVGKWYPEHTRLGIKGMTGTATGVHVHWETRPRNGAPIDPEHWLRSQGGNAGGGNTPINTDEKEDDDMAKNSGFYYQVGPATRKHTVYLICNTDSGFVSEYSNGAGNGAMPSGYNNAVAGAYGTGSFASITEGHAKAIKSDLAVIRAIKAAQSPAVSRLELSEEQLETLSVKVAALIPTKLTGTLSK
jgi:hypothetical protein